VQCPSDNSASPALFLFVLQLYPFTQQISQVTMNRSKKGGKYVSAIFIHAGAGYHRRDFEKPHLKVCEG
jgi:hypothetical protein